MEEKEELNLELTVFVKTIKGGNTTFQLGFPKNQILDIRYSASILTGALSMLIKTCNNEKVEMKDSELFKTIINRLEEDFLNPNSFNDSFVHDELSDKTNKENVSTDGEK